MTEANPSAPASSASSRLRMTNTFMAIVVLLLLGQVAWQEMRISSLKADVEQAKREVTTRAERIASDKLHSHREELVNAVAFVDDLYRSPDGLMRPGGVY